MRGQQQKAQQPVPGALGWFFQPKLTVNASGDQYEREADRVAERVITQKKDRTIQNLCLCCKLSAIATT
jgi:hypothetical protein